MPNLTINRNTQLLDLGRNYRIYANNNLIGKIGPGETKEFSLPQGEYAVTAKIDWCGSQTLTLHLDNNEPKRVTIKGLRFGVILAALPVAIIPTILSLTNNFNERYYLIPLIICALPIAYYLSFGRKSYLRISEEN